MRLRPSRARRPVAAALLPLLLGSCFTMALWGFQPDVERDPITGRDETVFAYDEGTEWSWSLFFVRVIGTPFALVLDCLTAPVQVFLWGDEEESR